MLAVLVLRLQLVDCVTIGPVLVLRLLRLSCVAAGHVLFHWRHWQTTGGALYLIGAPARLRGNCRLDNLYINNVSDLGPQGILAHAFLLLHAQFHAWSRVSAMVATSDAGHGSQHDP